MLTNIKIKQHVEALTKHRLNAIQNLIIVLPPVRSRSKWPAFPYSDVVDERLTRAGLKGCPDSPFILDLPNKSGTRVTLACLKANVGSFERLSLARKLVAPHLKTNPRDLALCMPGMTSEQTGAISEAVVSALLAATTRLPNFKSKTDEKVRLRTLEVFGVTEEYAFQRALAEAEGNALARTLTALPPNELSPQQYRIRVEALAERHGWEMAFHGIPELEDQNAGAFLAVARGSPNPDAGIVHLRYTPQQVTTGPALALVGKGICFDTGGTNLKPAKYMHGMHEDMEGSAVALGTLLALTRLRVDFRVDCWLALAENHIGPKAYRQNEVVTALNETTIEVVHTDAEGRMVLADTLTLATREKPVLVIDYATLTGACIAALGTRYSGAFANREAFLPLIIEAGRESGERVWPFPQDEDYDEALESKVADVKQCTLEGGPDHILAARFLRRFLEKDRPWIHIDLAAGHHKGGLAHIPSSTTGFGIRFTLNLLLDQHILQASGR